MTFEEYQNKIENQESAGEALTALMENIAHKTQLELVENFGDNAADILDKKNCINMRSFLKKSGGELSKEEVKHDEKSNQEKELAWSGATNEGVRKYYKEKFGYDTTDELLHQYRTDKLKHKGTIVEMAITSLLYKFLHDKYIVVRASTYDDYANGIDNVIVNKQTGEVICTFDEVYDNREHERVEAKNKKILDKAMRGGAKIKYGFSLERGEDGQRKLVKRQIQNIPTFYLAMTDKQLDELLQNRQSDAMTSITASERAVFEKLLSSLTEQIAWLQNHDIPSQVRSQIDQFANILEKL
ncbi:MAG: hypothetical protein ACKKL5_02215 [Candidatus Komeilibacteria bacterium]